MGVVLRNIMDCTNHIWPKNLERTFVLVSFGLVLICYYRCSVQVHIPLLFFLQEFFFVHVLGSLRNLSHDYTKNLSLMCSKTSGSKMSWLG